jgi:adenosylhomocysteine nucleosidase
LNTIGIIAALKREVKSLIDEMEGYPYFKKSEISYHPVYEGMIKGKKVIVVISGVGKKGAERATRILVDSYSPDLIITTGYAGSLSPDFVVGDVVEFTRAVSKSGEKIDFITPTTNNDPSISLEDIQNETTTLTVDRFIASVAEKKELGRRLQASIVDMESLYVGKIAVECGVSCLGIRVVSDDLGMELPKMSGILDREGKVIKVRAIRYFVRHPGAIVPILIFLYNIRKTTRILAEYIEKSAFL